MGLMPQGAFFPGRCSRGPLNKRCVQGSGPLFRPPCTAGATSPCALVEEILSLGSPWTASPPQTRFPRCCSRSGGRGPWQLGVSWALMAHLGSCSCEVSSMGGPGCGCPRPTALTCRGTSKMSQPTALRSDALHCGSWRTFSSHEPHMGLKWHLAVWGMPKGRPRQWGLWSKAPGMGGGAPPTGGLTAGRPSPLTTRLSQAGWESWLGGRQGFAPLGLTLPL